MPEVTRMIAAALRFFAIDRPALEHGLRLALSAALAFVIATLLQLENAYWAAMPIWVVTQSSRGLLLERAFFRIAGTLLGAAVGLAILHANAPPYAMLALLSLWVAVNTALVHVLRGVHAYGTLLAGMTAGVVVLPSVLHPLTSFGVAESRVACTLIGVGIVTAVTAIWTPVSSAAAFFERLIGIADRVSSFVDTTCASPPLEDGRADERRLVREIADAQADAALVTAGSVRGYRQYFKVHAFTVAALAVMAAAQRTGERSGERFAIARAHLAEVRRALGDATSTIDPKSFGRKAFYFSADRDARIAAETGIVTGSATFLAGALGYVSGWQFGELAALGVLIYSLVLGSLPAPKTIAPVAIKGCIAGLLVALAYRFALQPHIATELQLTLSLLPFFLVAGLVRVSPRTQLISIDCTMTFLLASQAVLPAVTDGNSILESAAALLGAAILVTSGFMVLPARADRQAALATRALTNDIVRTASLPPTFGETERRSRATRQVLRIARFSATPAGAAPGDATSLIAAIALGDAIADLRAAASDSASEATLRANAGDALTLLRDVRSDPRIIARALEARADAAADANLASALHDIAVALRASSALLRTY